MVLVFRLRVERSGVEKFLEFCASPLLAVARLVEEEWGVNLFDDEGGLICLFWFLGGFGVRLELRLVTLIDLLRDALIFCLRVRFLAFLLFLPMRKV